MYVGELNSHEKRRKLLFNNLTITFMEISMNNNYMRNIFSVFFVVALILSGGCASTENREGMGEYVDDSIITARVKGAILAEKTLSVAEINVETFKGVVQLSGFVNSTMDQRKAVEVAKSVSGVKSVKDSMQLK